MPKICLIAGWGVNDSTGDVKNNPHYQKWDSMLRRCYKPCSQNVSIIYEGCTVDERWKHFSEFEKWSKLNYVEGYQLDKDLLVAGNKIYGPDFCRYVPAFVNSSVVTHDRGRGEYPLGISKMKPCKRSTNGRKKPFIVKLTDDGVTKNFGYFADPLEGHKIWQLEKAKQLQKVLSRYSECDMFDTQIACSLNSKIWKLLLDNSLGIETKGL